MNIVQYGYYVTAGCLGAIVLAYGIFFMMTQILPNVTENRRKKKLNQNGDELYLHSELPTDTVDVKCEYCGSILQSINTTICPHCGTDLNENKEVKE